MTAARPLARYFVAADLLDGTPAPSVRTGPATEFDAPYEVVVTPAPARDARALHPVDRAPLSAIRYVTRTYSNPRNAPTLPTIVRIDHAETANRWGHHMFIELCYSRNGWHTSIAGVFDEATDAWQWQVYMD